MKQMRINQMSRFRFFLLTVMIVIPFLQYQMGAQTATSETYIYKDALAEGWNEWLWDAITVDYNVTNPVYAGARSMAIRPERGWTAWNVISETGIDDTPYAYFTFAAQGNGTTSWWEIDFLDAKGNPYSPNNTFKFQPATTWKKYTVDLNEYNVSYQKIYGIRFWYVTTDPASSTLYVDEMGFGGSASAPTPTPILPPQHLSFVVDVNRPVNHFDRRMLGVAHGNWDYSWGKPFPGQVPGLDVIYKAAHVGLLRYAGGAWANWVGWERSPQKTPYTEWHPEAANYFSSFQNKINTANTYAFQYGMDEIDSLGDLAKRSGADVMIQVNLSQNDPYMWADMVHYTNIEKGYHFKYWELGNELDLECYKGADDCLDASTYQARAASYIKTMKAVDPGIVIVGGAPASAHDIVANQWVDTPNLSRYLFAGVAAGSDALSYHWYSDCNATSYENIFTWSWTDEKTAWQNNYSRSWGQIAPSRVLNEIIKPTGKALEQGVTELNDDSCDFSRAPQNSNQITAVWYADILGRLAYNGVDFVTWYEGYGNGAGSGYPSVAADQDYPTAMDEIYLRPVFNTLFLYGNFFGDQMVQVTGPEPLTTSLWASTDSSDPGTLKLIVVNLYSATTTIKVNLSGFVAAGGDKYEMTNPKPLDRTAASNGPAHGSTINGFKLASTNIATAKSQIPKRTVTLTANTVTETFAPYSVTAIVLRSGTILPSGKEVFLPQVFGGKNGSTSSGNLMNAHGYDLRRSQYRVPSYNRIQRR